MYYIYSTARILLKMQFALVLLADFTGLRSYSSKSSFIAMSLRSCVFISQLEYGDAVRALLAAGADPTIVNKEGATSYDYCAGKTIQSIYNGELLQAAASSKYAFCSI